MEATPDSIQAVISQYIIVHSRHRSHLVDPASPARLLVAGQLRAVRLGHRVVARRLRAEERGQPVTNQKRVSAVTWPATANGRWPGSGPGDVEVPAPEGGEAEHQGEEEDEEGGHQEAEHARVAAAGQLVLRQGSNYRV